MRKLQTTNLPHSKALPFSREFQLFKVCEKIWYYLHFVYYKISFLSSTLDLIKVIPKEKSNQDMFSKPRSILQKVYISPENGKNAGIFLCWLYISRVISRKYKIMRPCIKCSSKMWNHTMLTWNTSQTSMSVQTSYKIKNSRKNEIRFTVVSRRKQLGFGLQN